MGLYSTPGLDLHLQSDPGGPFDPEIERADAADAEVERMSDDDVLARLDWRDDLIEAALDSVSGHTADVGAETALVERLTPLTDAQLLVVCRDLMGTVNGINTSCRRLTVFTDFTDWMSRQRERVAEKLLDDPRSAA